MGDVFISYSRRDKEFVRRLHEALASKYDDVWVDWEDIPSASDWWDEIKAGIEAADTFILIVTPEAIRSEVVNDEIIHAVKHNKRFVPVIHKDITEQDDHAIMHPAIKVHNWIMFREQDNFESSFHELVQAVNTDLDYVRMHTRILVRGREWANKDRDNSYLLDGSEIREAEIWLATAIGKTPQPTDLHTEYIFESRKFQNARQRRLLFAAGVAVVVAVVLMIAAIFFSFESSRNAEQALNAQETSEANYLLAQANADFAATQEIIAQEQADIAIINANRALTQEARAQNQADIAETNAQEAINAQQTSDANYLFAQTAGAEALLQADIASTNEQNAVQAQQTSDANYLFAQTAGAEALLQADIASTNEQNAVQAQQTSDANYLFAQTAGAEALLQADIASTNEQNAIQAQQTSDANVVIAQTAGAEALLQADIAETNAQVAINAQQISDANVVIAQTAGAEALLQAGIAQTNVMIANAEGTNVAIEGTNVAIERDRAEIAENQAVIAAERASTNEADAVQARETSDANFNVAQTQEQLANANAQIAIDAQQTAEYNAQQALSQALAFNSSEASDTGDYDLALALALESARLNPNLVQTQQLINELAYSSARFSFENSYAGEISPNELWVVGSQGTSATIYELESRAIFRVLDGHEARINDATFNPNSTLLATASEDNTIIIWDIASGEPLWQLGNHTGAVNDIEFSPDGTRLLSGSDDNTAILWDISTGQLVQTYSGNPSPILRLRFGQNNSRFYTWHQPSANEEIMSIWETTRNQPRSTVDDSVYQAFDPSGRLAVSGGDGTNVIVYVAFTLGIERDLNSSRFDWANNVVTAFGFRPENGSELMIATQNIFNGTSSLIMVNVGTQATVYFGNDTVTSATQTFSNKIDAIGFRPDASQALLAIGGILTLIDVNTGAELSRLAGHNDTITSIEYTPSGNYALSRSRDNNVRVWDTNNVDPVELNRYVAETAFPSITNPGISPDNSLVYSAVETSMFIWNAESAQRINSIGIGQILNTVYSPVDPYALVITEGIGFLYNLQAGEFIYNDLTVGSDTLRGPATISPDGQYMAVQGSSIYIWRTADRTRTATISTDDLPPQSTITDMQLTPDNRYLLVSTGRPNIGSAAAEDVVVFDVETGEEVNRFGASGHLRTITSIAISPDGTTVVTASNDDDLILWDIASGRQLLRFTGHTDDVNVVRFSPDGRTILSASDDSNLILWSVENGQPIRRFTSHSEPITGLYLSPDGTLAVTSTGSNTMIVWRIETLESVIEWTYLNRHVPELTCPERLQYNIAPLCENE